MSSPGISLHDEGLLKMIDWPVFWGVFFGVLAAVPLVFVVGYVCGLLLDWLTGGF